MGFLRLIARRLRVLSGRAVRWPVSVGVPAVAACAEALRRRFDAAKLLPLGNRLAAFGRSLFDFFMRRKVTSVLLLIVLLVLAENSCECRRMTGGVRGLPAEDHEDLSMLPDGAYLISPYDNVFRSICAREGNDWRLLSAIAYHESRFRPQQRSPRGAWGMMQIMPSVARQFAVDPERRGDLCTNIRLANLLLNRLDSLMRFSTETAAEDRLCLLLAAYNSGYGHVSDARRLARAHGEDAESWEVVSRYLRLKSDPAYLEHEAVHHGAFGGSDETLAYVDDVRARYAAYCRKAPR